MTGQGDGTGRPGAGRRLALAVAVSCVLALAACGKRGPLQSPQVTTGVDEQGEKIREPAPAPDYSKPFILDPLLF